MKAASISDSTPWPVKKLRTVSSSRTRVSVVPAERVSKYAMGRRRRCATSRAPSSTSMRLPVW